jgi:hypothetical protein
MTMNATQRLIGAIAILAMPLVPAPSWAQSAIPEARTLFDGKVTLLDQGKAESIAVDYKTWMIAAHATVDSLPLTANTYVVVEVHSGKLTTVIADQRQSRRDGEFWVVAPGQRMSVVTDDRAVILHTLSLPSQ